MAKLLILSVEKAQSKTTVPVLKFRGVVDQAILKDHKNPLCKSLEFKVTLLKKQPSLKGKKLDTAKLEGHFTENTEIELTLVNVQRVDGMKPIDGKAHIHSILSEI